MTKSVATIALLLALVTSSTGCATIGGAYLGSRSENKEAGAIAGIAVGLLVDSLILSAISDGLSEIAIPLPCGSGCHSPDQQNY